MKINLELAEDKQLRSEIHKMIKGQVTSISREQIKEMIISALGEKKLTPQRIEEMATANLRQIFENWIHDGKSYRKDYSALKAFLKIEIKNSIDAMKDFIQAEVSKHVSAIVKDIMQEMIEKEVDRQVKKRLKEMLS